MIRRILPLVFAFACVLDVSGQSTRDGSIYSRFGIGELRPFFSPRAQAMGGSARALGSTTGLTLENPAALSDQLFVRAITGFEYQGISSEDAAGVTSRLSSGGVGGVILGLPLLSGKLGLGLGLTPYSRIGYKVASELPLDAGDLVEEGTLYRALYQGNGGIERLSLGLGYSINPRISVGVRGDFLFGILETVQRTQFFSLTLADARISQSTRLRGFSGAFGIRANTRNVLRDADYLAVAATISLPAHLTGERVLMSGESAEPDTLGAVLDGSVDLPVGLGLGVAYHPSVHLTFVSDLLYEPWTSFESTFSFPGYVGSTSQTGGAAPTAESGMGSRLRVSGGIEFLPGANDLLAGYLARTAYRLGVFYEQSYVSPDPTQTIRATGVTGGLSFPMLIPGTRLDINLEAGSRGSASGVLVRDRFIRFGVQLNFAERWFARRRLG